MPYKDKDRQLACQREWYSRNKEKEKKRVMARKKKLAQWLKEYKKSLVCARCSEDDFRCLQFHHTDKTKEYNISEMAYRGISKKKIIAEINKCIVLFANCHMIEHYEN